jgi:hypothetical protein
LTSMKDYFKKAIDYFMKKFVQSQFPSSEPADSHHIEQARNVSSTKQGFWNSWRVELIGLFSRMDESFVAKQKVE